MVSGEADGLALRGRDQFALPHRLTAAHDRPERPAGDTFAAAGRSGYARGDRGIADRLAAHQIEDGEVGVMARRAAPIADNPENAQRAGAQRFGAGVASADQAQAAA